MNRRLSAQVVMGFLGGWIAVAAIAGSNGEPTPFGMVSVVCGGLMFFGVLGSQVAALIFGKRCGTSPTDGPGSLAALIRRRAEAQLIKAQDTNSARVLDLSRGRGAG